MSRKRRNTSSAEPESPPSKRRQSPDFEYGPSGNHERPQVDASTGLAAAFPGLDDSEDIFYGPARDGIDYLRMVRTEANGIPGLLTAPRVHHAEPNAPEYGNYDGFFDEDEAVIAGPTAASEPSNGFTKAQDLYYESILSRFERLRTILHSTPPLSDVQRLSSDLPISFPASSKAARQTWETLLTNHAPIPVQVACMDADSIFELIRLITKKMRKLAQWNKEEDIQRLSAWIWASLAKCPDRGELGGEEISDLRAYARAADLTWKWLQGTHDATADDLTGEEDEEDADDGVINDTPAIAAEGSELPGKDPASHVGLQKDRSINSHLMGKAVGQQLSKQHVILDTIITVVGETYGQRDLLELRRAWTASDDG